MGTRPARVRRATCSRSGRLLPDSVQATYRLHIRPKAGDGNAATSVAYCLANNVVGMGWGIGGQSRPLLPWQEYWQEAMEGHGRRSLASVQRLHAVRPGDFIWTRDTTGRYFLSCATGTWEYRDTEAGRRADILNVVSCTTHPVSLPDDVPGKVIASFRAGSTLQQIRSLTVAEYTRMLWSDLTGIPVV